jgi:hypothetical protein
MQSGIHAARTIARRLGGDAGQSEPGSAVSPALIAAALRPSTTSSSRATPPRRRVRSTIPVTNAVGLVAVAAVHAVSSTPTAATRERRVDGRHDAPSPG